MDSHLFSDISKIVEVNGADAAQPYLDLGWVLLDTCSSEHDGFWYSLGWKDSNGEMKSPTPKQKLLD